MSVPAYAAYKDSGVEWIGDVPVEWSVAPLFSVAKERDRPNTGMAENNLLSLSYGAIVRKDINENDGLLPASFETYQIVEPGDIVWRLTDLQNDKRSLRTAAVRERGIITSAYLATRPVGVRSDYLHFLLRAYDQLKVLYSMGGGLRQSMKFSDVKWLPLILPPPTEQAAIASFLDRETGKIDALVEEQRRLIALLKEKRQAVISHAVTKGLNPAVPMKDSGIEWLGEVPAHWEVKRLKHVGHLYGGAGFPHDAQGIEDEELSFFKVGDLAKSEDGRLMQRGDHSVSIATAKKLRATIVQPGSVVYAKIGAALLLNRRRIVDVPCCIDNNMTAFTPSAAQASSAWSWFWLSTSDFGKVVNPGAVPSLSEGDQAELPMLVPPLAEQEDIAALLEFEIGRIDALMRAAECAATLLQDRRAALISAAVTGKIDVRGLVAVQDAMEVA